MESCDQASVKEPGDVSTDLLVFSLVLCVEVRCMLHIISISNVAWKKIKIKERGDDLYGGFRIPGTGWVEGSKQSGGKFEKNKVGGRYQAIRDQLVLHKTRDRVGVCNQVIGERAIRGREQSGSDCSRASDRGATDREASDW